MNGGLDDGAVPEVNPVEDADRKMQGTRGQPDRFERGKFLCLDGHAKCEGAAECAGRRRRSISGIVIASI